MLWCAQDSSSLKFMDLLEDKLVMQCVLIQIKVLNKTLLD